MRRITSAIHTMETIINDPSVSPPRPVLPNDPSPRKTLTWQNAKSSNVLSPNGRAIVLSQAPTGSGSS